MLLWQELSLNQLSTSVVLERALALRTGYCSERTAWSVASNGTLASFEGECTGWPNGGRLLVACFRGAVRALALQGYWVCSTVLRVPNRLDTFVGRYYFREQSSVAIRGASGMERVLAL